MKEWWDPFTCNAERRFDTKVKCQSKQARQGQIPHFKEQKSSQMPWYAWGEWAVLAFKDYVSFPAIGHIWSGL